MNQTSNSHTFTKHLMMTLWWKYKFRTPIHTNSHTIFFFFVCSECVYIFWPVLYVCCLGSDYHYTILVHRVKTYSWLLLHTFLSISLSCSFILSRSLAPHSPFTPLALSLCMRACLCICIMCVYVFANFKFQSGFFQLNTFRIQYRLR